MCPRRLRCQAAAQSWLDSTATKAHVWRACRAPAPRGFACGTGVLVDGPPKAIGRLEFRGDRKSTRLNSSHQIISYAVFCLKKKKKKISIANVKHTSGVVF